MFHPTRTGDIFVETHAPNMLVTRKNSNPPKGMHGYDPSRNKEMDRKDSRNENTKIW